MCVLDSLGGCVNKFNIVGACAFAIKPDQNTFSWFTLSGMGFQLIHLSHSCSVFVLENLMHSQFKNVDSWLWKPTTVLE